MTDTQFQHGTRQTQPIYQTLSRTHTRQLISLHVDERQAAGEACILCRNDVITDTNATAYGRLLGTHTDVLACTACTDP